MSAGQLLFLLHIVNKAWVKYQNQTNPKTRQTTNSKLSRNKTQKARNNRFQNNKNQINLHFCANSGNSNNNNELNNVQIVI